MLQFMGLQRVGHDCTTELNSQTGLFLKTVKFFFFIYITVMVLVGKATPKSESEMKVLVAQSCLTLYNPTDWGQPGSWSMEILQARIVEFSSVKLLSRV